MSVCKYTAPAQNVINFTAETYELKYHTYLCQL